ncbi:MAG: mannose-1-phosphate guanylyltransferase/mannose-6-phosphate isomerase [Desulfobacterales bacterium]|nr:MAG: mannose-1-phosphate guanylyltransferase/mannose-6-phosphate isomerase [Desulfobacterales bacterium]
MIKHKKNVYPVLLAGGSGTRLWPLSRELYPKQLVKFIGDDSLVQNTIKRLTPVLEPENIRVVCGKEHFHEISRHMTEIEIPTQGKLISEPCGRNTAPAILLAMLQIHKDEEDAVLCVFPADHVIQNHANFHDKLASAILLADAGYIVTFGIKPHYPETGYGYIEGEGELIEQAFKVKRFVEKPDLKTAEKYIQTNTFFWNSGMFAFKISVMLQELAVYQPEMLNTMKRMVASQKAISNDAYEQLPNISIDYAVMEKTDKGAVLPSDFGWSDIGSWKSLYDFLPKDPDSNVIDGDVIANHSENSLIMGYERLIATNNLNHMVVVETPDAVFVSDMESSRDVKTIVETLKERGRKEYQSHKTAYHPWGTFTVLEQKDDFRVARYVIDTESSLELETDAFALKYLIVAKGSAKTVHKRLGAGQFITLVENETIVLENTEKRPLIIVEVRLARP